jgi:hypothetical protein
MYQEVIPQQQHDEILPGRWKFRCWYYDESAEPHNVFIEEERDEGQSIWSTESYFHQTLESWLVSFASTHPEILMRFTDMTELQKEKWQEGLKRFIKSLLQKGTEFGGWEEECDNPTSWSVTTYNDYPANNDFKSRAFHYQRGGDDNKIFTCAIKYIPYRG